MHPHLERRHRRPRPPRDFVVRQAFHMLQHEYFALFRREVQQRPLESPHLLRLLERPIGPVRSRDTVVSLVERAAFPLPAAPLRITTIAPDQEQPPRKLVRLPAIRQAIERPHQRVVACTLLWQPWRVARSSRPVAPCRITPCSGGWRAVMRRHCASSSNVTVAACTRSPMASSLTLEKRTKWSPRRSHTSGSAPPA